MTCNSSSAEILIGQVILQIICEWCDTPIDLAASSFCDLEKKKKTKKRDVKCFIPSTVSQLFFVAGLRTDGQQQDAVRFPSSVRAVTE